MEHIIDADPDIVFFTETWLQSEKNSVTAEVKSFGYKLLHDPRKEREKDRGGGVGIMVRDSVMAKHLPAKHFKSFGKWKKETINFILQTSICKYTFFLMNSPTY